MTARSLWAHFMKGLGRREDRLAVHAGPKGLSARLEPAGPKKAAEMAFIPWPPEGPTPAFLNQLWSARRWPRAGWVLSVPVKHGLFRPMNVPASAVADVRAILSLQALRLMPLSAEEIVTDFVPLKMDPKGSDVLMAVLLSEELEKGSAPFRAAGLEPGRLLPAPLSQAGLELGAQDLAKLLKAGDGVYVKEAMAKPAPDESLAEGALRWSGETPNFLPPSIRDQSASAEKRRTLLVTSALAAGILMVFAGLAAQKASALRARLVELRTLRAGHALQVRRLSAMERQVSLLQADGEGARGLPAFLKTLVEVLPQDVALEGITYDRERGAVIQGMTFSFSKAVAAVNALEKGKRFSKVEMKSSNAARLNERDVVSFQIECLWPERKGEPS